MDFFSLADGGSGGRKNVKEIPLPDIDEYTPEERMLMEKETTGLYLSGHPMDQYREAVRRLGRPLSAPFWGTSPRRAAPHGSPTTPADHHLRHRHLQQDEDHPQQLPMAYVTVEDDTASIELLCSPGCWSPAGRT